MRRPTVHHAAGAKPDNRTLGTKVLREISRSKSCEDHSSSEAVVSDRRTVRRAAETAAGHVPHRLRNRNTPLRTAGGRRDCLLLLVGCRSQRKVGFFRICGSSRRNHMNSLCENYAQSPLRRRFPLHSSVAANRAAMRDSPPLLAQIEESSTAGIRDPATVREFCSTSPSTKARHGLGRNLPCQNMQAPQLA